MAIITEVGRSPAEPLGNRAAELALELYIVGSMFCAVCNSGTDAHGGAFTAYELLRFELLIRFLVELSPQAVLHAAEVRSLTLVALIVGAFKNCIVLDLAEIFVSGVLQTVVLV